MISVLLCSISIGCLDAILTYKCVAINRVGFDSFEFQLNVKDRSNIIYDRQFSTPIEANKRIDGSFITPHFANCTTIEWGQWR